MPVAEPSSASGLWPLVKAAVPWPATDEDAARALAVSWEQAATAFEAAGDSGVGGIGAAWPDAAGALLVDKLTTVNAASGRAGAAMREVSARVRFFADVVADAKTRIAALITVNIPLYEGLSLSPTIAASEAHNKFVSDVITMVAAIIEKAAARIAPPAAAPAGPPPGAKDEDSMAEVIGDWAGVASAVLTVAAFIPLLTPIAAPAAVIANAVAAAGHGADVVDKLLDPTTDPSLADLGTLASDMIPYAGALRATDLVADAAKPAWAFDEVAKVSGLPSGSGMYLQSVTELTLQGPTVEHRLGGDTYTEDQRDAAGEAGLLKNLASAIPSPR